MIFKEITNNDLDQLKSLQPDGWPDIIPEFNFYINSPFCFPVKTEIDGQIAGIGTAIKFEKTGWLAHIIVGEKFRRKGIGGNIVNELIQILQKNRVETYFLIASELGKPVYLKAGFKEVTEYVFLKREDAWKTQSVSPNIVTYRDEFSSEILNLDFEISGENREVFINTYIKNSLVYLKERKLLGFYIPGLREGLIYAIDNKAGTELMKVKYSTIDNAVLPFENTEGIKFLKENGFIETTIKGTRMVFGKPVVWKSKCVYSRIGGNFG
jgi:GNAT superfamily N-acetyltransferase